MRTILPFCLLFTIAATARAEAAAGADPSFDQAVLPYLQKHCLRCHGEKKEEGELRLDTVSRDFLGGAAAGKWGDILERISGGTRRP